MKWKEHSVPLLSKLLRARSHPSAATLQAEGPHLPLPFTSPRGFPLAEPELTQIPSSKGFWERQALASQPLQHRGLQKGPERPAECHG